jgi:D-glycero-D-manno-heptose 1,7-bisphosphate phosphatase
MNIVINLDIHWYHLDQWNLIYKEIEINDFEKYENNQKKFFFIERNIKYWDIFFFDLFKRNVEITACILLGTHLLKKNWKKRVHQWFLSKEKQYKKVNTTKFFIHEHSYDYHLQNHHSLVFYFFNSLSFDLDYLLKISANTEKNIIWGDYQHLFVFKRRIREDSLSSERFQLYKFFGLMTLKENKILSNFPAIKDEMEVLPLPTINLRNSKIQYRSSFFSYSKKVLFLDRDDIIIHDIPYLNDEHKIKMVKELHDPLRKLKRKGYYFIVVSNQSGIAREKITFQQLDRIHRKIDIELKKSGIVVERIYYSPFHPTEGTSIYSCQSLCRKPRPGMVIQATKDYRISIMGSFMLGDKDSDCLDMPLLKSMIYKKQSKIDEEKKKFPFQDPILLSSFLDLSDMMSKYS